MYICVCVESQLSDLLQVSIVWHTRTSVRFQIFHFFWKAVCVITTLWCSQSERHHESFFISCIILNRLSGSDLCFTVKHQNIWPASSLPAWSLCSFHISLISMKRVSSSIWLPLMWLPGSTLTQPHVKTSIKSCYLGVMESCHFGGRSTRKVFFIGQGCHLLVGLGTVGGSVHSNMIFN